MAIIKQTVGPLGLKYLMYRNPREFRVADYDVDIMWPVTNLLACSRRFDSIEDAMAYMDKEIGKESKILKSQQYHAS